MKERPVTISRKEAWLPIPLRMVRRDDLTGEVTASADASGFFWRRDGKWFIVTNLHVVTGWNYETNSSLSPKNAFRPTDMEFKMRVGLEHSDATSDETIIMTSRGSRIPLEEDDRPRWLIHPLHGSDVDVIAIEAFDEPETADIEKMGIKKIQSIPVNVMDEWVNFKPAVADPAYVLGFPKGMNARGFSIWKRASIASEPDLDIDKLPKLLIDTATREGMSGAPVIVLRSGVTAPSGVLGDDTVFGDATMFLGVYSGRIGDDPLGLQLGIVWKAHLIDEIIDGNCRGMWP